MNIEHIIYIYLGIAGIIGLFIFLSSVEGMQPREVENFWDGLIYSLLWIAQPIKAIIKFIKNLL